METYEDDPDVGGRPPSRLPQDLLDMIQEPPVDDPVAAARWLNRFLYRLLWAEANGKIPATLGQRLRATAGAIVRSMPAADQAELDRRLKAAQVPTQDVGGAALEPIDG